MYVNFFNWFQLYISSSTNFWFQLYICRSIQIYIDQVLFLLSLTESKVLELLLLREIFSSWELSTLAKSALVFQFVSALDYMAVLVRNLNYGIKT